MNTQITIINAEQAELDLLADCLADIARNIAGSDSTTAVLVEVKPRTAADAPIYKHPGWLEYGITYQFAGRRSLFVAAIQRTLDAETEFCS
jgi:hypothetical protein